MARKPPKFTFGEDAQDRKGKPARPQAGDMRTARSEPEPDRLQRAIKRSAEAAFTQKQYAKEGKPKAGEIYTAESGENDEQARKDKVRKFLHLAKERFKLAAEAENHSRAEALDDLEFRVGQQWPKDLQMSRNLDGRPCLTMNRLPAIIRQVTNQQRQQRPATQINPVGDGSDTDTAEIFQGIIRHIEVASDAEIAYDTAFEHCVTQGFGYWRIIPEMVDEESNRQELRIKRVKNPFSVYWDPASVEPCYEDARYCLIIEDVPISEYQVRYKETEAASLADFSSVGDNAADWATKDTIRVAEYFFVEEQDNKRTVKWAKINAVEIIDGDDEKTDGRELPGKFIPIIPVIGDDIDVNGRRHTAGIVRHAKDAQRAYNFWVSAGTETIALAPRAPFVAIEGQIEGHETEWKDANVRSIAVLQYKQWDSRGAAAPAPPQRQVYEPPIQAITMMVKQSDMDLKAITGLFDPSLGQNKSDQSGKAIQSLQQQGDIATLNFSDNLARSIRHNGRVLIDLIPYYYDAAHVQRIIKPDGSIDQVIVHNDQPDAAQSLLTEKIKRIYDIGVGDYDVTVSVGPTYQTKRKEDLAVQTAIVQAYPAAFPIIGDLLIGNMDSPQSKEMAKRLKQAAIKAGVLSPDDAGDTPEAKVMQLQAQLAAISQQHEQLAHIVQQQAQEIETKQVEANAKVQIEQFKAEKDFELKRLTLITQREIAEINARAQDERERAKLAADLDSELHVSAHELAMQKDQQAHEKSLAQQQAGHDLALAKAKPKPTNGKAQ